MTDQSGHPSVHVTCAVCGAIVNGVGIVDHADGDRRIHHVSCWNEKHDPDRQPQPSKAYRDGNR